MSKGERILGYVLAATLFSAGLALASLGAYAIPHVMEEANVSLYWNAVLVGSVGIAAIICAAWVLSAVRR